MATAGMTHRALGLTLGVVADAAFGDPRRGHPVALFGTAAQKWEAMLWRDSRWRGALFAASSVGAVVGCGIVASRIASRSGLLRITMTASATWAVLGAKSLAAEAHAVHKLLGRGDLTGARERVGGLVARDTALLGEAEIARAAVESVAENSSDAIVAPLVWGAVAGIPGLLGYRAINTLDAMVGYRNDRYRRFGWAAARLDDAANLIPSRMTALLTGLVSGHPRRVCATARRDAPAHPSPNAGWPEAAFAGALGVRLGGANDYGGRIEHRAEMGDGRGPRPADLPRAVGLLTAVTVAATGLTAAIAVGLAGLRRQFTRQCG